MLFRQGDIYIEAVRCLPKAVTKRSGTMLVDGELTGHRHRVRDPRTANVYVLGDEIFVDVIAETAEIVHEEHGTIALNRGVYRVWRQREYEPGSTFGNPTGIVRRFESSSGDGYRLVFD